MFKLATAMCPFRRLDGLCHDSATDNAVVWLWLRAWSPRCTMSVTVSTVLSVCGTKSVCSLASWMSRFVTPLLLPRRKSVGHSQTHRGDFMDEFESLSARDTLHVGRSRTMGATARRLDDRSPGPHKQLFPHGEDKEASRFFTHPLHQPQREAYIQHQRPDHSHGLRLGRGIDRSGGRRFLGVGLWSGSVFLASYFCSGAGLCIFCAQAHFNCMDVHGRVSHRGWVEVWDRVVGACVCACVRVNVSLCVLVCVRCLLSLKRSDGHLPEAQNPAERTPETRPFLCLGCLGLGGRHSWGSSRCFHLAFPGELEQASFKLSEVGTTRIATIQLDTRRWMYRFFWFASFFELNQRR